MIRNVVNAAWRHLMRSRAYAAISVGGLAVGLCAAAIAALVIRNQLTFDHDIPGYDRTYVAMAVFAPPGIAPQYGELTEIHAAERLRERFAQVEATSRAIEETHTVRIGAERKSEEVVWADANLLDTLPLRVLHGDARAALESADGVVLSQAAARRFFNQDAPLGATLSIDDHPMTVRAIVADRPPRGTHAQRDIIAPARAAHSATRQLETAPQPSIPGGLVIAKGFTYVRLKPGADVKALLDALPETVPSPEGVPKMLSLELVRIDGLNAHEGLHPGFRSRMTMLAILGAVVLLIAAVNFVNLQTARAGRRLREVAIRKLAGATRGTLIAQHLGEALAYALAATVLALALVELLLPHVNALLDTGGALDLRRDPLMCAALPAAAVVIGVLAGAWPAFVVSRGKPSRLMHGSATGSRRHGSDGHPVLVALQFALLIGLAICAGVVHRQREFALDEALRLDHDQVVMVMAPRAGAMMEELRGVPGIRALTRSDVNFLGSFGFEGMRGISLSSWTDKDGRSASINVISVDLDLFDFYGISPLAGRLPRVGPQRPAPPPRDAVVLNETASRLLGFASAEAAIGQVIPIGAPGRPSSREDPSATTVLAVVPDFTLGPVSERIQPTVYFQAATAPELISVRLEAQHIPTTLAAIDAILAKHEAAMAGGRSRRFFLDRHFELQTLSVLRQSQAFGICALIAIALSCLGLFAMTAAAAEKRTREIGVRKALGARTAGVVRLLLWRFTRPVVWGVLIAWPVAAWWMQRWLDGFAYHVDLPIALFPAAAVAAILIALATVTVHTLAVARTRPAVALRHE